MWVNSGVLIIGKVVLENVSVVFSDRFIIDNVVFMLWVMLMNSIVQVVQVRQNSGCVSSRSSRLLVMLLLCRQVRYSMLVVLYMVNSRRYGSSLLVSVVYGVLFSQVVSVLLCILWFMLLVVVSVSISDRIVGKISGSRNSLQLWVGLQRIFDCIWIGVVCSLFGFICSLICFVSRCVFQVLMVLVILCVVDCLVVRQLVL